MVSSIGGVIMNALGGRCGSAIGGGSAAGYTAAAVRHPGR
jgi:hypothetical protein